MLNARRGQNFCAGLPIIPGKRLFEIPPVRDTPLTTPFASDKSSEHFRPTERSDETDQRDTKMLQERGLLTQRLGVILVAICSPSMLLMSQTPTGSISGIVQDASGAVIPYAIVAMSNQQTGLQRSLASTIEGSYSAAALPPGVYQVKVTAKGFRTTVREATVETGANTTVNLRLEVGLTEEVISVEAASTQIDYVSNTIAGVITREK